MIEDTINKVSNEDRAKFAEQSKKIISRPDSLESSALARKTISIANIKPATEAPVEAPSQESELSDIQSQDRLAKVTFSDILREMDNLHTKKNTDYGNAWHEEINEFGPICGVLRLYEKTKRLSALYKNGKAQVNDESFEDTLIDIANYAVMTIVELRNKSIHND